MRSVLLAVACGLMPLSATSPVLPAQLLPVYGGGGGTAFTRSCGAGKVLTGLRYRANCSWTQLDCCVGRSAPKGYSVQKRL